ncbi:hypothetical protein Daus18300_006544 [Diaporthe australafricana]|uniref:Integral membrane protein n=1 Tax=Diaporthe australafricana TaxID=127596 RepID=A0ABR3WT47_9PEZI
MASRSDTGFPLIPAPMALAVDTLSAAAASSSRRSPVPSRTSTSAERTTAITPTTPSATPAAASTTTATTPTAATIRRPAKNPRHPIFNEDIFSRFYATPFLALHFALYCAVPLYYLLHYSPFRDFGGPGGALNHVVKWSLFVLTQYATAVIVTSWDGRYRVQRDAVVCVVMLVGLAAATGLKALVFDGMAVPKG